MSKNSASILVFGIAVLIISIVGIGLLATLGTVGPESGQMLLSGQCPLEKSYYLKSDLTRSEQRQFSSNAVALSVVGSSQAEYRIIMDYAFVSDLRDKAKVRIITNAKEGSKLSNLSISLLLNGIQVDKKSVDSINTDTTYNFFEVDLGAENNSLGILLERDNKCELKLIDLVNLNKSEQRSRSSGYLIDDQVIKNITDKQLTLESGYNYIGSDDWFYPNTLRKSGFLISSYDTKTKKWIKTQGITPPNQTLAVFNPSQKAVTVNFPEVYRVPDDINSPIVFKGWNFLYARNNQSPGEMKLYFNPDRSGFVAKESFSVRDLIDKGFASPDAYFIENGQLAKIDLLKPDQSDKLKAFWFYIKKEPESSYKQINLNFTVEGGGETYDRGGYIPLKVVIRNDDNAPHYLIDSGVDDPCQISLIVSDKTGKKIYDSNRQKNCPLWPNLAELSPENKKEYNYIWKAPNSLTGEIKIKAYFNYSRLGGRQLISEAKINLK